ncbi:hypothetical protein LOC67_16050 [Stieleria sp. JC731]|uniref:hypothetical protein n=1 Tax=Pirellulaceae TaxID=2691357 RepID=UPI001E390B13|nr:hypothetical protein [Stieleria sp. JC731]MCC9602076.1 hypothetical protein [Stieleria sp. JC731]
MYRSSHIKAENCLGFWVVSFAWAACLLSPIAVVGQDVLVKQPAASIETRIELLINGESFSAMVHHRISPGKNTDGNRTSFPLPTTDSSELNSGTVNVGPADEWILTSQKVPAVVINNSRTDISAALQTRFEGIEVVLKGSDDREETGHIEAVDRTRLVLRNSKTNSVSVHNLTNVNTITPVRTPATMQPKLIARRLVADSDSDLEVSYPLPGDAVAHSYRLINNEGKFSVQLQVSLVNTSLFDWPAGTEVNFQYKDRDQPTNISTRLLDTAVDDQTSAAFPLPGTDLKQQWLVRFDLQKGIQDPLLRLHGSKFALPSGAIRLDATGPGLLENATLSTGKEVVVIVDARWPQSRAVPVLIQSKPEQGDDKHVVQKIAGTLLDTCRIIRRPITIKVEESEDDIEFRFEPVDGSLWRLNARGDNATNAPSAETIHESFTKGDSKPGQGELESGSYDLIVATKNPNRVDVREMTVSTLAALDDFLLDPHRREYFAYLASLMKRSEAKRQSEDLSNLARVIEVQSRILARGGEPTMKLTKLESERAELFTVINRLAEGNNTDPPQPCDLDQLIRCLGRK